MVAGLGVATLLLINEFGRDLNTTVQGVIGYCVLALGAGVTPLLLNPILELLLDSNCSVYRQTTRFSFGSITFLCNHYLDRQGYDLPQLTCSSHSLRLRRFLYRRIGRRYQR